MAGKGFKFNDLVIEVPQEYLERVIIGEGQITFFDQASNKYEFFQQKVDIDKELSLNSANPVENKVVTAELNSVKVATNKLQEGLSGTNSEVSDLKTRTASKDTIGGIRMWTDDTTLYISTSLYDNEVEEGSLIVSGAYTITATNSGIKIG